MMPRASCSHFTMLTKNPYHLIGLRQFTDLRLKAQVVIKTVNMAISRCFFAVGGKDASISACHTYSTLILPLVVDAKAPCCFAEDDTDLFINACRTGSTLVVPHSTKFLVCRWRSRCRLPSLMLRLPNKFGYFSFGRLR